MKKNILNVLASTAMVFSAIGCTKEVVKTIEVPGKPKAAPTMTIKESASAEELAIAAEQLVSFYSFNLADMIFDRALAVDPSNKRALFYKDILRPFMKLEGSMTRFKLAFDDQEYKKSALEMPETPLKSFLTSKEVKDVTRDIEAQDFLVEMRDAFIESSRSLKNKLDWELTLNINPFFLNKEDYEYSKACTTYPYTDVDGNEIEEIYCDEIAVEKKKEIDHFTRKVSTAEILAFQNYYAGMALFLIPYTTWSLEGADEIYNQAGGQDLTYSEVRELALEKKNLLILRKDHALAFIPELGSSLISATKWAIKYQDRLCPKNVEKVARKGHLIQEGICLNGSDKTEAEDSMTIAEALISGKTVQEIRNNNSARKTQVDLTALWLNPVSDLKTIMPAVESSCKVHALTENPTLNGIFPKGDFNEVVEFSCQ